MVEKQQVRSRNSGSELKDGFLVSHLLKTRVFGGEEACLPCQNSVPRSAFSILDIGFGPDHFDVGPLYF